MSNDFVKGDMKGDSDNKLKVLDPGGLGDQLNAQAEAVLNDLSELGDLEKREARLRARKEKLDDLERELRAREKELKAKDARRKQIILRLPESLWRDIADWADDDFRSINSQIEYILTKSVKEHKGKKEQE